MSLRPLSLLLWLSLIPSWAAADASGDRVKLSALCQTGGDSQPVCDCQAGIVVSKADGDYVRTLAAMSGGVTPEAAMRAAGMTAGQFVAAAEALDKVANAELNACKSAT